MKEIKGVFSVNAVKLGVVISRFNEFLSKQLLSGCIDELARLGVQQESVTVVWVPGAFEIPFVAKRMAKSVDAVICLGVIIRGETPHFDFIASETAKGIASVSLTEDIPVIYGIITADSVDQAVDRSGTKLGNRGRDAARTALEMISITKQL